MIKYIYYYIWLLSCSFSYFFIKKPIFWLIENVGTKILRLKKQNDKKIKKEKLDFNKTSYDFPDGISHWYIFAFLFFIIFMILLIPFIKYIDTIEKYISIDNNFQAIVVLILLGGFLWYWVYIKKSNKEWLKKKVDKKKKDFYVK